MNPSEPPRAPDAILPQTSEEESATAETQLKRPGRIVRTIRQVVQSELRVFSGPLPPPEILIQYNEVFPDCGKVIVEMAQKEQQHRHASEDRQAEEDNKLARRGQLIGGALAMIAVLGAIYLLANDKSIMGLSILGAVVVAFGGAFVYDRYQRAKAKETGKETQELDVIPSDSNQQSAGED